MIKRMACVTGIIFIILLAGCGMEYKSLPDFSGSAPADVYQDIQLPADELPHNNLSEWWYFTGHLDGAQENPMGFEFVIFQANRELAPTAYAAHFAISDIGSNKFVYAERNSVTDGANANPGLNLCVGGWKLALIDSGFKINANMPGYSLDLLAVPQKPVTLHDNDGLLDFSPYGWSYYYSYTRLQLAGVLTTDEGPKYVTGQAWMDHQWGDFVSVGTGGWDWFRLQLDDGRDFTASFVFNEDREIVMKYGTLVSEFGAVRHLTSEEFAIKALDSWTSPTTGATYPSGWDLTVKNTNINLTLIPVMKNQELDTRASTGQVYWEGAVEALIAGNKVGRGFVELTGYYEGKDLINAETGQITNLCDAKSE